MTTDGSGEVSVVVTGTAWMGTGIRSVGSALKLLFDSAEDEIIISAYTIGTGGERFTSLLETALARGIKVRLIVNRFEDHPPMVISLLSDYASRFTHLNVYTFRDEHDLHAKVIISDRKAALVGSPNLSHRGLLVNHEIALFVRGPLVDEIAQTVERLFSSHFVSRILN